MTTGTYAFFAGASSLDNIGNSSYFSVTQDGEVTLYNLYYWGVTNEGKAGYDPTNPSTWVWARTKFDLYNNAFKIAGNNQTIKSVDSSTGRVTLSNGTTFNTATSIQLAPDNPAWSGGKYSVIAKTGSGSVIAGKKQTSEQVCVTFFHDQGGYHIKAFYWDGNGNKQTIGGGDIQNFKLGFNVAEADFSSSTKVNVQTSAGLVYSQAPTLDLTTYWSKARNSVTVSDWNLVYYESPNKYHLKAQLHGTWYESGTYYATEAYNNGWYAYWGSSNWATPNANNSWTCKTPGRESDEATTWFSLVNETPSAPGMGSGEKTNFTTNSNCLIKDKNGTTINTYGASRTYYLVKTTYATTSGVKHCVEIRQGGSGTDATKVARIYTD